MTPTEYLKPYNLTPGAVQAAMGLDNSTLGRWVKKSPKKAQIAAMGTLALLTGLRFVDPVGIRTSVIELRKKYGDDEAGKVLNIEINESVNVAGITLKREW